MSALADARREVVRQHLPFRLENDRSARFDWSERGLALAQRDWAVEELVAAGQARLKPTQFGVEVEAVTEEARP